MLKFSRNKHIFHMGLIAKKTLICLHLNSKEMRGPTRSLISAFNCYSPSGKYRKFWKFSLGFNFCVKLHCTRNIFKKIYDIVTEDIFDTRNVRIFKEVEKKRGIFILFYVFGSAELGI